MADIRIKDLTTTASSTASDDFIAIDGTTNGTRKLNAFSPTFGGNATVTGNLTVNTALSVTNGVSANELTCTGGYAVLRGFGGSADTGALYLGQSTNNNFISSNLTTMASYIANTAITSTVAAGFRVLTSTASTTTSSGALVVSGGVGVAGAINAGVGTHTFGTSAGGGVNSFGSLLTFLNIRSTSDSDNPIFRVYDSRVNVSAFEVNARTCAATLAGALTAGGNITIDKAAPDFTLTRSANTNSGLIQLTTSTTYDFAIGLRNTTDSDLHIYNYGTSNDALKIARATSAVTLNSTTASTSTSSGALVVSGGLGVAGAINAAGTITSTASTDSGLLQLNLVNSSTGTSASSLFRFNAGTRTATLQAYNDTHATLAGQLRVGTSNGNIVLIPSGVTAATFGASSIALGGLNYANTITGGDGGSGTYILQLNDGGGSLKVNFKGNGDIALSSTTASTTTSSGALVVSGGVGVGGNLSIGGDVLIDKSAIEVLLKRGANTNDGLIKFQTGIFGDFGIGHRGTSDSDLHIYNYGTAADALKIAKSDSLATFAAAIRTAAPSGGTAANWKLGTVATVSPTSPNRTIEVDIGGTIYYIHAKTTNN